MMENHYIRLTTGKQTKKIDYYPNIMRNKDFLYKRVTLPSYKHVLVKVVNAISDRNHTGPKPVLWRRLLIHPTDGIHCVVANKPFEIILANFSAVEKKFPKRMVISYAR